MKFSVSSSRSQLVESRFSQGCGYFLLTTIIFCMFLSVKASWESVLSRMWVLPGHYISSSSLLLPFRVFFLPHLEHWGSPYEWNFCVHDRSATVQAVPLWLRVMVLVEEDPRKNAVECAGGKKDSGNKEQLKQRSKGGKDRIEEPRVVLLRFKGRWWTYSTTPWFTRGYWWK